LPHLAPGDVKALVAELRHDGLCTLDEAHVLIDLHAAAQRDDSMASAMSDMDRQLVARATEVVERVVNSADVASSTVPLQNEYRRASGGVLAADVPVDRTAAPPPPPPRDAYAGAAAAAPSSASPARANRFVIGLVVVCLVAAGVAALLFSRVLTGDPLADGIAAYESGQRVVARLEFEKALADDPTDARPLIYLGRLSREEGDVAQARRLLEQAVQRAPDNPLTHRELGSALLADGQPELARRFYVRALTLDPDDRLAQGFLGCSLARLGRVDEAQRWLMRAGPGDWNACAAAASPMRPPGMP
jgi:tetratricopeptide (TPR) repeat protein